MTKRDTLEPWAPYVGASFSCDETASYPPDLSVVRGKGPFVWFEGSNEPVIDLIQGYSTTLFGHCDDDLTACAVRALSTMDHISGITSAPRESLAALLAELTPVDGGRVYFDVGGAHVVAQALRVGCRVTGRRKILGLRNAFHGYSAEGEFLSAAYIGPAVRTVVDEEQIEVVSVGNDEIFDLLESRQYGACIIEPIQGAAGLLELPVQWVRELHRCCRAIGTPLISDEVQVGLGRTGTFAAVERYGIEPDMVTYGKGLCGGLFPLSALVLSTSYYERLPTWPKTALGSTFSCSPFACALGAHVVERVASMLRSGEIRSRSGMLGVGLQGLAGHPPVVSVRTYGLAIAVDLESAESAQRFVRIGRDNGLLVYACGPDKDVVKLYPPYNITDEDTQMIVDRLWTVALAVERNE